MTFVLDALRDKPEGLFLMDDGSPFQDYSGNNRSATITGGTPATHPGLVKGASFAPVVGNTTNANFDVPVFEKGMENNPFTLAAWIRLVDEDSVEQQVLGSEGQVDGITIKGTVVSFVMNFQTTGTARCSFDIQRQKVLSIYATHTQSKNALFVNGELVSEIDLTEEQKVDSFAGTSTKLVTGSGTSTTTFALNAVGVYSAALSGDTVLRQFNTGIDKLDAFEVVENHNGDIVSPSLENNDTITYHWKDDEDWQRGQVKSITISNDELKPQFRGDTSIPGTWADSVNLSVEDSIYGVMLEWDGPGVLIETSLDGITWSEATRGERIASINNGFATAEKSLGVRASFSGGIVGDPSVLNSLNVIILHSNVSKEMSGRTITYNDATPLPDTDSVLMDDSWGVSIAPGGSIVVSPDALEGVPARTVELWIKATSTTNPTVSVAGTIYQNGAVSNSTLIKNKWTLLHIVADADVTTPITITGSAQVGQIALYDTALAAQEIGDIVAAYNATNIQRVNDSSVVSLTASPEGTVIYGFDWAITGAG